MLYNSTESQKSKIAASKRQKPDIPIYHLANKRIEIVTGISTFLVSGYLLGLVRMLSDQTGSEIPKWRPIHRNFLFLSL